MKICVVTGTRAEFGLLSGLMHLIEESETLHLQLVVTGAHLLEEFGHTIDEITTSGFSVDWKVTEITHAIQHADVAHQVGSGVVGFTNAFSELEPDVLVILGDRYEMLAAAVASFFLKIPVVHIHGGEVTHGAFDDVIRHAITKFSSMHCVSHSDYAQRVIQLGENPETVHVVGSLGVDRIHQLALKSKSHLERDLGISLKEPVLLVTYHPVTHGESNPTGEVGELIAALEAVPEATVISTMPNADPGHDVISDSWVAAAARHQGRWLYSPSLGQVNYWSVMALSAAVVGNSSSGILEAPSFSTPTINIGPRQDGRIMSASVVNCIPKRDRIEMALQKVLSKEFQHSVATVANPLGGPGAAEKIHSLLENFHESNRGDKVFYDLSLGEKACSDS